MDIINNAYILDGDTTRIFSYYWDEKYEIRVGSHHMNRLNREVREVTIRRRSDTGELVPHVSFRDKYLALPYKKSGMTSMTLSRFLKKIDSASVFAHAPSVVGRTFNYTDEDIKVLTPSELAKLTGSGRPKGSGKRGITMRKRANGRAVYEASIHVDSKRIYLGVYPSRGAALKVREQAEIKYWGQSLGGI